MARVLITREFAEPLASHLRTLGHEPVHVSLIELVATGEHPPRGRPDAVLVTSKAAVRFAPDLSTYTQNARVSAVGEATAEALRNCGVEPSHVGRFGGIAALDGLEADFGEQLWFVGAENPSAELSAALTERGATRWSVYRNRRPDGSASLLKECSADALTFTSGSAVLAYVESGGTVDSPVAVLGETTAIAARQAGFGTIALAREHTMNALAEAVATLV